MSSKSLGHLLIGGSKNTTSVESVLISIPTICADESLLFRCHSFSNCSPPSSSAEHRVSPWLQQSGVFQISESCSSNFFWLLLWLFTGSHVHCGEPYRAGILGSHVAAHSMRSSPVSAHFSPGLSLSDISSLPTDKYSSAQQITRRRSKT